MFESSDHEQLASSLESIAAAFAVLQVEPGATRVVLVSANTLFEAITGRPIAESIGATLDELLPGSVEKTFQACIARCLHAQTSQDDEIAVERNVTRRWWRLVMTPIINADAHGPRLMVTLIDISDKKALERRLLLSRERVEAVVEASSDDAVTWAERARVAVAQTLAQSADGREVKVTISVGLATMRRDTTFDVLIDLADKALYRSKALGRNRVSVA